MEKIKRKIHEWGSIWLNLAGKVVLIKSVLNSYLLYQSSILLAPAKVISQLEGLIRSFLWQKGSAGGGKKFALVSWKIIKLPRPEGGLFIRDIRSQNLALGAKMLWNLVGPKPSWCSQVLKAKYFRGLRLRCLDGEHVNQKGSSIYHICFKALPTFKEELHWVPGNGKSINIWHDKILDKEPPQIPRLQEILTALGLTTLWDFSNWEPETPHRWAGWSLPDCHPEINEELKILTNHLAGLAPIAMAKKDRRGWGRKSGIYTTAEGYQLYAASFNVPSNPQVWNNLWNRSTLPKIDTFAWTLAHSRILTSENLQKRGMAGPFRCPLCMEESETISHLFLQCTYTKSVWEEVLKPLGGGVRLPDSIQDWFISWE